jgi:hypothetical protein
MEDYAAMYSAMHARNSNWFKGTGDGWKIVNRLVAQTKPRSILDYGSGKGFQYSQDKRHEAWGGPQPHCYDIGWPPFAKRPKGPFDAVLCMDVMEHIAEPDVDAILADIFSFLPARDDGLPSFAFFWVSCRPAKRKKLPDGRNVHLTVKPGVWWGERIINAARPYPHVILHSEFETEDWKP